MKTPFIKRESKEDHQDRVAAAQARRAAKIKERERFWFRPVCTIHDIIDFLAKIQERKRFWFQFRLTVLSIPLAFLLYVLWLSIYRPLPLPFRDRPDQKQFQNPIYPPAQPNIPE